MSLMKKLAESVRRDMLFKKAEEEFNLQFGGIKNKKDIYNETEDYYVYNRKTKKICVLNSEDGTTQVIEGGISELDGMGSVYMYGLEMIQRKLSHEVIDQMVQETL